MLLENEFLHDPRVEKEVKTLYNAGHQIIVAAITSSDLSSVEKLENCTVLRKYISKFTLKSSVGALKFPFYFNFWRRYLREIIKKHKIDVIHVHDLPLSRVGIEFKNKLGVKLIIDLHENWAALLKVSSHTNTFAGKLLSSNKQWSLYEKACAIQADAVITVVEEMKNRISQTGISPEKIIVLQNTPELRTVSELKFQRDENYFTLLYVGGISYHRGLQHVIDGILLLVSEIPVRLWIAGEGKYSGKLKEQVKRLSLKDNVEFFGHVNKEKTESLMKKADIGLIPHVRSQQSDNSSPNKLYEYMSAGLPVLASDCLSVKRIVEETKSGLTYVFDSPSDFANEVKNLYNNRDRSVFFAANGKKAIKEKYNWELGSEALVKLYSDFGEQ
jgi:glycosyltransferase involved in cell wall biosynthesis